MPAVDLKFHFFAASCAAPYDEEASTSIVPFLTCTHVYVRIVSLLFTRILPQYPTWRGMSTGKYKKDSPGSAGTSRTIVRVIHPGAAGPESLRAGLGRPNNCSGCHPRQKSRTWQIESPEPEPEQFVGLFPARSRTRTQKPRFIRPRY